MSEQRKYPPIVRLTWIDSAATYGWVNKDDENIGISEIHSIGYVVREDKKTITISTSWNTGSRFMDPLTIPKCCIIMRK